MAILYKANETQFNHLGLGPLNDAVSILVTEERNGIFELEMKYPVSGKVFHELKNDRIIKADAGHKLKDQRFKIIRISKPLKGIVTVYAEHVSYLTQDLALKPKVTFSGNARQALEHWKANLVDDNPFTVWSDISTTGKINWTIDEVENARRALGGVQGSILDVYGGEYLFDNYDIYLYQKRGVNSELLIAYGRNLVDLEQEEEIANTYTSIYPYSIYTDDDGNERMVTLPEYYIDSEHVDKYARRKILVVDFTTEEIKTVSALRSAARRYIKDNDVGVPKVNLKIQYVDLAKTLDYKHLALYEEVNLCDNVMIYFEKYDINTTAKVIKVVWDVLNERYDSIEVGEARASLSQAIDTVVDGKVHNVEKLAMQTLRTADGKNTIYFGLDEPLATQYPLKKNDIWYRIVDGEFTRTYIYDGVVWKLVIDMDSQEAKAEAQQAKERADEAVERANQATADANTAISQAQASFDLAQENATTIDSLGLQIGSVENGLMTISGTVDGLQTTVSDVQGNVSTLTQLSDTMQTRLTDAEGNINTLTQTVDTTVSRISSLANPNLITHDSSAWEEIFTGLYALSVQVDSNEIYTFKDHSAIPLENLQVEGYQIKQGETYTFKSDASGEVIVSVLDTAFFGQLGNEVKFKLEKGDTATAWTAHDEDIYSQYSQLKDAINLRVAKGDVINQINLDTSGVLISGKKLILDGDTTVTGQFKVGNANITSLNAGKITTGTLDAGKISVINLSANSIVGGILQSQNSNTVFNLNNGNLTMQNANFTLGGGANIEFLDRANKITYRFSSDRTRVAGLGVGVALGNEYPFAYLGTTGASELDTLSPYFSGFVANTTARIARDNSANSVYGKRFRFISDTDYNEGITIDFFNNYTTIESFGKYLNFGNLNHLYGLQGLTIRNYYNKTSGWLVETNYAGDGGAITLRGLSAGTYNYQIGSKSSRILNIYLRYNPDVLSDERLKTDISDIDLGLNFIKRIKAKQFKLKLTDADIIQGAQNKLQYGVIAQQVNSVLADFGVSDNSLITESEDGYYGAQYGQFIAPLIKSVQELDTKLTDNVEFLKLKVQYLEQKIKQLEGVA